MHITFSYSYDSASAKLLAMGWSWYFQGYYWGLELMKSASSKNPIVVADFFVFPGFYMPTQRGFINDEVDFPKVKKDKMHT